MQKFESFRLVAASDGPDLSDVPVGKQSLRAQLLQRLRRSPDKLQQTNHQPAVFLNAQIAGEDCIVCCDVLADEAVVSLQPLALL
jgi:hypothetical protein